MTSGQEPDIATIHYFVDEAGDPTLFDRKGRVIVGTEGCSKYFILGKLDIDEPGMLGGRLEALRAELLADPWFKGVPSMQPERKKTALAFHAKDDLPEVRREVFRLLTQADLRFYAVTLDKRALTSYVQQQNESDASYRYNPDELYDTLVSHLFRKLRWHAPGQINICFAKRGSKSRTQALRTALERADVDDYGFSMKQRTRFTSGAPCETAGLQAVDYYLWALQRLHERGEGRYFELIGRQVAEVRDLDVVGGGWRDIWNSWRGTTYVGPATTTHQPKKENAGDIGSEG